MNADVLKTLRNVVPCTHDVADLEAGRDFDIDTSGLKSRGSIKRIGTETDISGHFKTFLVGFTAGFGESGDGVGLLLNALGGDGEVDDAFVIVSIRRKSRGDGIARPTFRQVEFERTTRRPLESGIPDRHDAGLRRDGERDSGRYQKRLKRWPRPDVSVSCLDHAGQMRLGAVVAIGHFGGQGIRLGRQVEIARIEDVVVTLFDVLAAQVGLGQFGIGGHSNGDSLIANFAGLQGASGGRGGREGPAFAGVGDELAVDNLNGLAALVRNVNGNAKCIPGDNALEAAVARWTLAFTAGTGRVACRNNGCEADAEGMVQSLIELVALDAEFMFNIVFHVGGQGTCADIGQQGNCLREAFGECRRGLGWIGCIETVRGQLDRGVDGLEALAQGGLLRNGRVGSDTGQRNVDAIEEAILVSRQRGRDARGIEMILRCCSAREWHGGAAVLRFLIAESDARNGHRAVTKKRIVVADRNGDGSRRKAVDHRAMNVVAKADRAVMAGCVVEDALGSYTRERHARVHFQRSPGKKPGGDLVGKYVGIGGCVESFLSHLARGLVVAVTVGNGA